MIRHIKYIIVFWATILVTLPLGAQTTVVIPDQAFLTYLKSNQSALLDSKDQLVIAKASTFADSLLMKGLGIKSLEGLQYFNNLKGLVASDNLLTDLPNIDNLAQLQTFNVRNNSLTTLPSLDNLGNLTNLYAENNQLTALPSLSNNVKMLSLQVAGNKIKTLPSLSALVKLNILDVSKNQLTSLPSLTGLTNLERLYCSSNQIITLPSLNALTNLKRINASRNLLTVLPSFAQNTLLTELVADSNSLTTAPNLNGIGPFKKIQLQNNNLTFDDFEQYLGRTADFEFLDYSPQKNIGGVTQLEVPADGSFTLSPNNTDVLVGMEYAWYRGSTLLIKSGTKTLTIDAADALDAGQYYCKITNSKLPTLTLLSDTTAVTVGDTNNPDPCPTYKDASVEIVNARCTELGSFKLSFADKLLDSIKLTVYDSQRVPITGISSTNYMGIKQGKYTLLMSPKNNACGVTYEQEIEVKIDKCTEIVLTPNNDGKDDILYFSQKGTATIFDKNGRVVKTLAIPIEWDGTNNDGILPQGYYLVKINNGNEYFNLSVIY